MTEAEEYGQLREAISELPPKQRLVLELRVFEELSFKEVAAAAGCTENAAKVNFHHAVNRLRLSVAVDDLMTDAARKRQRQAMTTTRACQDFEEQLSAYAAELHSMDADYMRLNGTSPASRSVVEPRRSAGPAVTKSVLIGALLTRTRAAIEPRPVMDEAFWRDFSQKVSSACVRGPAQVEATAFFGGGGRSSHALRLPAGRRRLLCRRGRRASLRIREKAARSGARAAHLDVRHARHFRRERGRLRVLVQPHITSCGQRRGWSWKTTTRWKI